MIALVADVALALVGLSAALVLLRIVRGPTLADRIVGLDVLTQLGIAVIAILAMRMSLAVYLDVAVVLALVGFVATIAFARFLLSREQP